MRTFLWATAAVALVIAAGTAIDADFALAASPQTSRHTTAVGIRCANGGRGTFRTAMPWERATTIGNVIIGKVTGFAKGTVTADAVPVEQQQVNYQVATVKVDTVLAGAEKAKEIKVGVIPVPKAAANAIGRLERRPSFEVKEGQELILFLVKHPLEEFYVIPDVNFPIDLATEQGKRDLETVKKVLAIISDPEKSLKSAEPEQRAEAATVLILKHRIFRAPGGMIEEVAIGADATKLLFKRLVEGNWSSLNAWSGGMPSALQAFQALGLGPKDEWIDPVIVNTPGSPQVDWGAIQKDAFVKWLQGPGKEYQIKKVVLKVKQK